MLQLLTLMRLLLSEPLHFIRIPTYQIIEPPYVKNDNRYIFISFFKKNIPKKYIYLDKYIYICIKGGSID